jgi:hypothetical protein
MVVSRGGPVDSGRWQWTMEDNRQDEDLSILILYTIYYIKGAE